MLFNSWQFFIFLSVVLVVVLFAGATRPQNRMLLIASYFFYGWWDWRFTSLLMISHHLRLPRLSIAIDNASNQHRRKLLLLISIVLNFGMLGFFQIF